jgi:hypothetical protein
VPGRREPGSPHAFGELDRDPSIVSRSRGVAYAPKADSPFDRQRRSKTAPVPGSGRPGDSANRRLRVRQVQPRQPFIGKYVPGWAKQLGIIERTDMEIRRRGQADGFASQR